MTLARVCLVFAGMIPTTTSAAWIMVERPGFGHRSFMDLGLLSAADSTTQAQALNGLDLVRRYTRVYFDWVVKGGPEPVLNAGPPKGVTVERF